MNTKAFCRRHGIVATCELTDANPAFADDDWSRTASHWKVTLRWREGDQRRQLTVPFSQGSAISREPTAEDVLDCLASDAASVEQARSFEDWCGDLGYDSDSRRAERTFKACEASARRLRQFLGASLYEALLYKTERL